MHNKLEIRDLINYLIPAIILTGIVYIFLLNFGVTIQTEFSNFQESIFVIAIWYVCGLFLRLSFSPFLKYKNGIKSNSFTKYGLLVLVGKADKKDIRNIDLSGSKSLKYIESHFFKKKLKAFDGRKDRFNLIARYVHERAGVVNLYMIERFHISFNLSQRLAVVFSLGFIISLISIVLKLFDIGCLSWIMLVFMLLITKLSSVISYRLFEKFYNMWCKNILLTFYCISELIEKPEN